MFSTQVNITLQMVATLSVDELAVFATEFQKNYNTQTKAVPVKSTIKTGTPLQAAQIILQKHQAKHNSPRARQLA